jgi:hypothetical protein
MGYGKRSRLARYSGAPINGAELELKQERERAGPRMATWTCPKCGNQGSAPYEFGAAVCEPAIDPEMMAQAIRRGGRADEMKTRKGCGWLLRLEPFGDTLTADDVGHVGPWRPSRDEVVRVFLKKILDNWLHRGVGPPKLKKAMEWRAQHAIEVTSDEPKASND